MKNILITGGLGYIGSHISVLLLNLNYNIIVIDNLSNTTYNVYDNICKITNKHFTLYTYDITDKLLLQTVFEKHCIDSIIHLAGLKSVNDSITDSLNYYNNNLVGTINLLLLMKTYNVNNIIFSSSATVYKPGNIVLTEESLTDPINPYGHTKLMIEQIMKDSNLNCTVLRYFNPIGNHPSGIIGNFNGNNLVPKIYEAIRCNKPLQIFGNDYNTPDGTCLRDYIHVMDLSDAHIYVLNCKGYNVYNVGTGIGTSVLELVTKLNIPYIFTNRRDGDTPILVCDISKIQRLGWTPKYDIDYMCKNIIS